MTNVPFFLPDCREIVADYTSMSNVFSALDFDAFIAGYCEYATWRSARGEEGASHSTVDEVIVRHCDDPGEVQGIPRIPIVTSKGELRERASYAA